MNLCENCNKYQASVRVTEVAGGAPSEPGAPYSVQERHLCEMCAQSMQLPQTPSAKGPLNIFHMLYTARRTRRQGLPACSECGMDLEEFRRRGRLGCPKCYEAFKLPVGELLERVHGARQHVGRLPGVSDGELERLQALADLRQKLEVAIRAEAYESAARLRDEIQQLESKGAARQEPA